MTTWTRTGSIDDPNPLESPDADFQTSANGIQMLLILDKTMDYLETYILAVSLCFKYASSWSPLPTRRHSHLMVSLNTWGRERAIALNKHLPSCLLWVASGPRRKGSPEMFRVGIGF